MTDASDPTPETPRDLFDRGRRAARRGRGAGSDDDFLGRRIAEDLIERLADVQRRFADVAIIGARRPELIDAMRATGANVTLIEPGAALAAARGATHAEEDRLPIEPESVDLILWPGGIEAVNDVPGALLRIRLALRPDGLLLGAGVGDGSFAKLRAALAAGDGDRPAARLHPQISLAALGDLMARVGFALPVVDVDRLSIAYRSIDAAVADLRAAGMTATLAGPVPPLTRAGWARARAAYAAEGPETIRIMHFSGWAPHPDQPKPARRGSATQSLHDALKSRPPGG